MLRVIEVLEKCNGCGTCTVSCQYLTENGEGLAIPVEGNAISDEDLESVKKIILECPVKALCIVEKGITQKHGKAGMNEVIEFLRKKVNLMK